MKISAILLVFQLTVVGTTLAQRGEGRMGGTIQGTLVDAEQRTPLSYANVVLYRADDSVQAAGTASNADGLFEILKLRPGRYFLRFFYMGYDIRQVDDIVLRQGSMRRDLGMISLERSTLTADEVEVTAGRLPLTYGVDKKVINVAEFQTAVSGNAVDVLEKVPSVNVDVDGNVSLRGSTNFTVLIDGRPSILDASEALQQIPAATIENIEIITNPSARYNPSGTSGIINIQLKKTRQSGRSGMVNMNAGATDRYGADAVVEQRNEAYSATMGIDFTRQFTDGTEEEFFRTTHQSVTSTLQSDGHTRRGRTNFGVRGSLDLFAGKKDQIGMGGRVGFGEFGRTGKLNYLETVGSESATYLSSNDRAREMRFYAFNTSYQHLFKPKNHQVNADFFFSRRNGTSETGNAVRTTTDIQSSGRKSSEEGPANSLRAKLDYLLGPETSRMESGYQYELNFSVDETASLEFDSVSAAYMDNPLYRHETDYTNAIHSTYALYSGRRGPLSYQGGLRMEYTDRRVEFDSLPAVGDTRWDLYPTVHGAFEFSPTLQGMASYTRRTERPRAWYLEPYETWVDAYTVRKGNPALKQEFIDSYEAGFRKNFKSLMISSEMFYRVTHNKVERVRSVYSENVTMQSVENIGKDYALGGEALLTAEVSKALSTNLTANAYRYLVKGRLFGESFSRRSFNWNLRSNNTLRLSDRVTLQADGQYESASTSSQGRREGFFMVHAAVRYEIIPRQLTATLQVRDVFGTFKHEDISEGPDFYNRQYETREAPLFMLNLRYVFNNYKPERQKNRNNGGMEEEEF